MKTLLTNVSNSFFVRNFLRSDVLKELQKNGNVRIVLLAPEYKLDYYRSEFSSDSVIFEELPETKNKRIERFFKFLETASIHSRTSSMLFKSNLRRRGSSESFLKRYLTFFERYLLWQLGRFSFWRNFIRRAYFVFSNKSFDEILDKYSPDLVFLPSMIYPEDYVLAKAAKKRGIKTMGMTLSWDNFYSKTLLLVQPDLLLVHTDLIVGQARKMGDFTGGIETVGIPQYDSYFKGEGIMKREDFFKKISADPSKKLIVYAFSGKAGLDIEFSVLRILREAIKSGEIKDKVEVLVRPYPRYDFSRENLESIKNEFGFLAMSPVSHPFGRKNDWEFDGEALSLLSNSLAHADLIITMYSTFFIEAAIFDKPLIAVGFDGEKDLDYWNSAKRFFDWNHLAEIKPLEGIAIAENKKDFINFANNYLSNPDLNSEGRKRIVRLESQFADGHSGERIAKTILKELSLNNIG